MSEQSSYTVDALLAGRDETVPATYARLLEALRTAGPVAEEAKKTSVHLTPGPDGGAFAGVHPRRSAILLNVRSDVPIASPRVRKVEQVSRNRVHNEMLLASPDDVDAELLGWLAAAYRLAGGSA